MFLWKPLNGKCSDSTIQDFAPIADKNMEAASQMLAIILVNLAGNHPYMGPEIYL